MTEKRILVLILIVFTLLGVAYAIITPIFEASDELWHYPMVRHLATGNSLPVQSFDPEQAGPWKQEASQPPLYYYLGAALTFWIGTSDMEEVRWKNPHVDNGVITADGNINMVVHDPALSPWSGTILAVRIIRLFSVLLGTFTVYLTYRIAKMVMPARPEVALGAAAVNAFTPMFLFISGSVNNDNLVIPLASLSLWMMIDFVVADRGDARRKKIKLLLLGVVIGLGSLTKITAVGLVLLAAFAIFIDRWRYRGRKVEVGSLVTNLLESGLWLLLTLIPILMIAGWWYYRNFNLYGDLSGWNAFVAILGQRAVPASLAQLWDERWGFMISYWGLFGGLNVPMPNWIYNVLNAIAIVATIGLLYYLFKIARAWFGKVGKRIESLGLLVWDLLKFSEDHIALILCILWSSAVIIGLIRWATVTWSSQGRLVFSSISALSTLLVVGLIGWMPGRPARLTALLLTGFMLLISVLAPFLWIQPVYDPAETVRDAEFRIVNREFDSFIRLNGYALDNSSARPGDPVGVTLVWETLSTVQDDWSVFVHLSDPILETPIAQRDMYPGQGLLSTRFLKPGDIVENFYQLEVPDTALAPAELEIVVGLYNYDTGERMLMSDGADSLQLGTLSLQTNQGTVPNPVSVNFEDQLELVGFALDSQRIDPGGTIKLALYWSPLRQVELDYTFFAQLVDENTTRWASQDLMLPTSEWSVGETQIVELLLPVEGKTPASVYPLIIGVYSRPPDGSFDRLQVVTEQGRLTDDFLEVAKFRIEALSQENESDD